MEPTSHFTRVTPDLLVSFTAHHHEIEGPRVGLRVKHVCRCPSLQQPLSHSYALPRSHLD